MRKKELIWKLQQMLHTATPPNKERWNGQRPLLAFLVDHFEALTIPTEEQSLHFSLEPHLLRLMIDAFEVFRVSADDTIVGFRTDYEAQKGYMVPDITALTSGSRAAQSLTVQAELGDLLRSLTGQNGTAQALDAYCNAQKNVLLQTFDAFLRTVYRPGMSKRLASCETGRMMFGPVDSTGLSIERLAGKVTFMFKTWSSTLVYPGQVVFAAEENGLLSLNAHIVRTNLGFRGALDLVNDVTDNWPKDEESQKKIFVEQPKLAAVG